MAKKSYYAVQSGKSTGVFSSWEEAKEQVHGYSGAVFKKSDSLDAAQSFASSNSGYAGLKASSSKFSGQSSHGSSTNFNPSYQDSSSNTSNTTSSAHLYNTSSIYANPSQSSPSRKAATSPVKKRTYDTVANEKSNGVFNDWEACKSQIQGHQGANAYVQPQKKTDNVPSGTLSSSPPSASSSSSIPVKKIKPSTSSKSSSKKGSYYAVCSKNGESMIYDDWASCKAAVKGQRGVTFKKFLSFDEAKSFAEGTLGNSSNQISEEDRLRATQEFLEKNSEKVLQEQRELEPTVIYTDGSFFPKPGSRKNGGVGGMGVYYGPGDPRNVAEPVYADVNDSYISEVRALERAMKNIADDIDKYEAGEGSIFPKYVISSDNEAAKNVLTKYGSTWSHNDFLKRKEGETLFRISHNYNKIKRFYHQNADIFDNHNFEVIWVKGHAGVDGNEAADRLAKEGAWKADGR